jgi:hypothetical protein
MDFGEEVVMKCRRVVSAVLAVLFAVMLAAWVVAMPGEGTGLYAAWHRCLWSGVRGVWNGCRASRGSLQEAERTGQPLKLRAITSRTS